MNYHNMANSTVHYVVAITNFISFIPIPLTLVDTHWLTKETVISLYTCLLAMSFYPLYFQHFFYHG